MEKKLMLIINPAAGRGAYALDLPEALRTLDAGGYRTTLYFTAGRGDATRFAAQHGGEYDTVACIGGDGTLSEVLAGLMQLPSAPSVGYIPMGTANDVATTLGLPKNDTVGAARLTKLEAIHTVVEYDEGVLEGNFLYGSMSNSTSVAGIVRLKETMVSLGDGLSELVLVKDPGSVEGFGELVSSVLSQRFDSDKLVILHTKKARFTFDRPIAWTRDGEAGGEHTSVELRNCHAPVKLIF